MAIPINIEKLLGGPIKNERVKNVALMMFSYHPEKFFPGTQIDIVIYPRGKDDDPDRTYFIISIPCHRDFVTDELMVDKNGNVVGKDWVTKLGQSYVESDVEAAIAYMDKAFNTNILELNPTMSEAGSAAGSVTGLLETLNGRDLSSRLLLEKAGLTYHKYNRDRYITTLVKLGLMGWNESIPKRSPNQTLHLTDLGKAVLQRIK